MDGSYGGRHWCYKGKAGRVFCVTGLGGLSLEGLIHGGAHFRNFTVFEYFQGNDICCASFPLSFSPPPARESPHLKWGESWAHPKAHVWRQPIAALTLAKILCGFPTSNKRQTSRKTLPGGTPGNSLWGCIARFSKTWPYFRPKYVIFAPVFRPGL